MRGTAGTARVNRGIGEDGTGPCVKESNDFSFIPTGKLCDSISCPSCQGEEKTLTDFGNDPRKLRKDMKSDGAGVISGCQSTASRNDVLKNKTMQTFT